MPSRDGIFDDGIFDSDIIDKIFPNIYPPSIVEPCAQRVFPTGIDLEEDEFGVHQLQFAIYSASIGPSDRYGHHTLISSIIVASLPDDDAFGTHTFTVGPVTIYAPSIQEECS